MIRIDSESLSWLSMGSVEPPAVIEPAVLPPPNPPPASCEETENALRDRIDIARYCTTDDDCTLVDFGYPIDCMTSVARSDITGLRLEYRKYEANCDFRVYFDCPAEPMERLAVCRENRCSVSLEMRDMPVEETLDYLGIGGSESND